MNLSSQMVELRVSTFTTERKSLFNGTLTNSVTERVLYLYPQPSNQKQHLIQQKNMTLAPINR